MTQLTPEQIGHAIGGILLRAIVDAYINDRWEAEIEKWVVRLSVLADARRAKLHYMLPGESAVLVKTDAEFLNGVVDFLSRYTPNRRRAV